MTWAESGGAEMEPQVHEWMFVDSFADLGGHQWEIMFKDEKAILK